MAAAPPQKKERDFPALTILQGRRRKAVEQQQPKAEAHHQYHLPESAEFEKLPSLVAKPLPQVSEQLVDAQDFPDEAPHHQDDQGPEQDMHAGDMPARLPRTQGGCQKEATRDIGRGDPEKRQLQMPGAQDVAGQKLGQVEPVKTSRFRLVMRQGPANQYLGQKEQRHDQKILDGGFLSGGSLPGQHMRGDALGPALPAQVVEFSEHEQHHRQPGQQHDDTQRAPQNRVAGHPVADGRIVGEIIGVRIRLPGPVGDARPCGPGKKGGQLADFIGVVDVITGKSRIGDGLFEIIAPARQCLVRNRVAVPGKNFTRKAAIVRL